MMVADECQRRGIVYLILTKQKEKKVSRDMFSCLDNGGGVAGPWWIIGDDNTRKFKQVNQMYTCSPLIVRHEVPGFFLRNR